MRIILSNVLPADIKYRVCDWVVEYNIHYFRPRHSLSCLAFDAILGSDAAASLADMGFAEVASSEVDATLSVFGAIVGGNQI